MLYDKYGSGNKYQKMIWSILDDRPDGVSKEEVIDVCMRRMGQSFNPSEFENAWRKMRKSRKIIREGDNLYKIRS